MKEENSLELANAVSSVLEALEGAGVSKDQGVEVLFRSFSIVAFDVLRDQNTDIQDIDKIYLHWKKTFINNLDASFHKSKMNGYFIDRALTV